MRIRFNEIPQLTRVIPIVKKEPIPTYPSQGESTRQRWLGYLSQTFFELVSIT